MKFFDLTDAKRGIVIRQGDMFIFDFVSTEEDMLPYAGFTHGVSFEKVTLPLQVTRKFSTIDVREEFPSAIYYSKEDESFISSMAIYSDGDDHNEIKLLAAGEPEVSGTVYEISHEAETIKVIVPTLWN